MAPKKNYTKEQMANAIEEVRKGVKISVAAKKHGVPRITLRNKITGKSPLECSLGPPTILTPEEEMILVKWILFMADNHFPVTKDHLLDSVQKIMTEKNLDTCPFKDNRPGNKWFTSFINRHPELAERTAQNLSKARDDVTEDDLNNWFEANRKYIEEKGLLDALNDPKRIFNADESAFFLQPKAGRVLVRKGEKNVYTTSGDEKENLTVLLTGNAAGDLAPPMIVYPYERLPALITASVPSKWCIGRSETGWMCAKTFYEFVANVFNPWLEEKNITKPVLLFLDGHRSHMTLHLAEFCKDNGIEIIALHPNATHLLQPMDVAVFRPLKIFWKNQVKKWKTENHTQVLKKEQFAPNLKAALENILPDTIRNGFRKSGLYPFGPEYVDMNKLSSHNRSTSLQKGNSEKAKRFLISLESEIKKTFTSEKIALFTRLFYLPRTELEELLPNEDLSLYTIWAKNKSESDNENLTQQESENAIEHGPLVTPSLDKEPECNDPSIPNALELTPDKSDTEEAPVAEAEILISNSIVHASDSNTQTTKKTPETEPDEEADLLMSNVTEPALDSTAKKTPETDQGANITPDPRLAENVDISSGTKQVSNDMYFTAHTTPNKQSDITDETEPQPIPSTSRNQFAENIPTPFKRALFWPDREVKKRRTKEYLPSAITSDTWQEYMKKKAIEKKKKQEDKERRAKERQEKKMMKKKNEKEKKTDKNKKKIRKPHAHSSSSDENEMDIPYQESDCDMVISEYDETEQPERNVHKALDEDNVPLSLLQISTKKKYVIIKYEGEYFPGLIKSVDKDNFEISTMILSKGNTFRWPEMPDQIWYDKEAIIEEIQEPQLVNKRGFYKVPEMLKYLPFVV